MTVAWFFYLTFRSGNWDLGPDSDNFLETATSYGDEDVRTWLLV